MKENTRCGAKGVKGIIPLFNPKTTTKLAARGFFIKETHPVYGMQWRITAHGREVAAKILW